MRILGAFVALLLACSGALANGIYIPPAAVAVKPAIPSQRAMIVFRDGVQTLIVESTYQANAPDAGWVIPVPSPSTQIETADPGVLESMSLCIGPRVRNELRHPRQSGLFLLFLSFIAMAVGVRSRTHTLVRVLSWVLIFVLFASILLPSLGTAGISGTRVDGIEMLDSQRVDSYDVAVIRADDSGALAEWLVRENLRPLEAADRAVFDRYIADGWFFVVSHLTASSSGTVTPHPLSLTFPVAKPVFPMRATALSNSTTAVELFIVADTQASAEGFECVVADQFKREQPAYARVGDVEASHAMRSIDQTIVIGHPDAVQRMWEGCIITRLDATLKPQQMASDVKIGLAAFAGPSRKSLNGPGFRRDLSLIVLFVGFIVLFLMTLIVCWEGRKPLVHERRFLKGLAIAVVVIPVVIYFSVRTQGVKELRGSGFVLLRDHYSKIQAATLAIQDGEVDDSLFADMGRFPEILSPKYITVEAVANPLTGEPMIPARTPDNYMILRRGEETYLCLYDLAARETALLLPKSRVLDPAPVPATMPAP